MASGHEGRWDVWVCWGHNMAVREVTWKGHSNIDSCEGGASEQLLWEKNA